MIRFGVVGCGDVAFRSYLPGLALVADRAQVVACFDPVKERAAGAAGQFPSADAYTAYDEFLAHDDGGRMDVVVNLTPAPLHRQITAQALETGYHVLSEKPLAATVEEAQALTALAESLGRLLLCAPAVMVTGRFRWLKRLIDDGRIGRPTLATGKRAGMGPASWRDYTGDPRVFYGSGVGPLVDTGVYLLHAMTGLLGPAKRVQALGGIVIPQRPVLIDRLAGQTVDVTVNDQMLLQIDFGDKVFAQLLSSFAVPATQAPALEIHGTEGSISINQDVWYNANGPVDLYRRDDTLLGAEGWMRDVWPPIPGPVPDIIQFAVPHMIDCLEEKEEPILTAGHACHVLELMLAANQAAETGESVALTTGF